MPPGLLSWRKTQEQTFYSVDWDGPNPQAELVEPHIHRWAPLRPGPWTEESWIEEKGSQTLGSGTEPLIDSLCPVLDLHSEWGLCGLIWRHLVAILLSYPCRI